ncbi:Uncharacterized conserved protein YbjT, contains NAD(P)-binding and DUF2867 domains [Sphingomonas gellani]|uniref:Uncharacterized conserved protein YbjT, contains NAD(P)-binding and DUF2867 domains n=1 Tax=Sphingomonas gellani TaxID=1166340 RepID=A0A1H8AUG9_9SPHN|nr:NAD-dependent dehydratase [Sphingomonas gellani]SEM74392.1 Uncharacterized conserved protein YbjT, contains NAD(P)-binding and DUF2867 domains [Sphingomonas gellani]
MTTILLAGATGMVGAEALALLLADERVRQVVAPTRRALPPHAKLRNPIVTSHDLQPGADWWAADGGISALGTTRANAGSAAAYRAIDYDYALAIASQVREAGATRFALTSLMGADPRSRFTYPRTKGELEDAVELLGFGSLTLVRPGVLSGHRQEHRTAESFLGSLLRAIGPILPPAARVSPAIIVAALLVEAVITGTAGRHVVNSRMIALAAKGRS